MYVPPWRINGYSTSHMYRLRLGGYFAQKWGQYGNDANGNPCTAEGGGFGIHD